MLSDTLFQAVEDIEEYQRQGRYEDWLHRIEPVKRAIRELQRDLDALPSQAVTAATDVVLFTPGEMMVWWRKRNKRIVLPLEISDLRKIRDAIDFVLAHRGSERTHTQGDDCVPLN